MTGTPANSERSRELDELRSDRENLARQFQTYKKYTERLGQLRTLRTEGEIWDAVVEAAGSVVPVTHFKVLSRKEGRSGYHMEREGASTFPDPALTLVNEDLIEWGLKNRKVSVVPIDDSRVHEWGLKSRVLVPLLGKNQEIGILILWISSLENELNQLAVEMLEALGRESATDIENLRLYGEIQKVGNLVYNVIESIPFGVVAIDLSDRIIALNSQAEYLFGVRKFFVVHENYQKAFAPKVAQVFTELMVSTLSGQEAIDHDFEHQLDPKTAVTLGVSTSILYDSEEKPSGLLFLCRDLSLSREVQKLRELDRMKTEFVHTVSHDLKTPLTAILGGTEILLYDQDKFTAEQLEIIKIVEEGGKRLQTLINDLLDLSRLESGRVEVQLDQNDIVAVANETIELVKSRGSARILTEYAPDVHKVRFDRDKIKQVMENLVSNAMKYSPKGGEVRVRIHLENGFLRVDVQDQGMGIPEECLPHIWDKFYRVNSSATAEIEGTGLGLSITKAIIEMHKGEIWAESKLDAGSTFSFRLPILTETADS